MNTENLINEDIVKKQLNIQNEILSNIKDLNAFQAIAVNNMNLFDGFSKGAEYIHNLSFEGQDLGMRILGEKENELIRHHALTEINKIAEYLRTDLDFTMRIKILTLYASTCKYPIEQKNLEYSESNEHKTFTIKGLWYRPSAWINALYQCYINLEKTFNPDIDDLTQEELLELEERLIKKLQSPDTCSFGELRQIVMRWSYLLGEISQKDN